MTFRNAVMAKRYAREIKLMTWLGMIAGKITGRNGRNFTVETEEGTFDNVKPWRIF